MEMQELPIHHREGTGKQAAKRLRRAGVVPAVLYGAAASEAISVDCAPCSESFTGTRGRRSWSI